MKLRIRKYGQFWVVLIPGAIPQVPMYENWTDALARVQMELRHRKGPRVVPSK